MFQLIPVFMLLISPLFLANQAISIMQLIGSVIITLAAITVTYEPDKKKINKGKLVTLAMMAFVSLTYAIWFIIERYVNQKQDFNQTVLWSNITLFIVGILIAIFLAVCIITTNKVSYIVTIALWMIILLVVTELLKDYKIPHLDYDLLMISLFIVYVVFHSILSTKNDRYFITVLPFIAFFITNAIYYFYSFIIISIHS